MTERKRNNYLESFIYETTNEKTPLPTVSNYEDISINENDTDLAYIQKMSTILNCKPFKPIFFDFENQKYELMEYLRSYSEAIKRFNYQLNLSDIEYDLQFLKEEDFNLNPDLLEIEMERIFPIYKNMHEASQANLKLMKEEILRLENNPEIKSFEKYKIAYTNLKNKIIDKNITSTRNYQNFKNRKIAKVLEEAIVNKKVEESDEKKCEKIAIQKIVKEKIISIDDLSVFLEIDKLQTLKIIFKLKNEKFIKFDQENEKIRPWTSNF